jgi:pimeloyl-ACP methyl ester carboxylesterase
MIAVIFAFFSVVSAASARADEHGMRIIKFQTRSAYRSSFDAYLYEPSQPSKGLVIFLHGGGCRALIGSPVHLLETLPLNAKLREQGYSILLANYTSGINSTWQGVGGIETMHADLDEPTRCKMATQIHLQGIRDMLAQVPELVSAPNRKIVLMGHSYGAYLVNLLATDLTKPANVSGFISYAGIWDPALRDEWSARFHVSRDIMPVSRNPIDIASILVIHSQDDEAVNVNQLASFENWLGITARPKTVTILKLKEGKHYTDDLRINAVISKSIDSFIQALGN